MNVTIDVIEKGRCNVTEWNVQIVMQTKAQLAAGQRTQAKQSRKVKVGPLQIDDNDLGVFVTCVACVKKYAKISLQCTNSNFV